MQAIRFHSTGGPEVLRLETLDLPAPDASGDTVRLELADAARAQAWLSTG